MSDPVWDGSDIVVALGQAATGELMDVVVDVDDNGDVLGIEVLGVFARHPGLTITNDGPVRLSVSADPDADALYVRFAHGRSVDQLVRQAAIVLDSDERLQGIRVRMEK